MLEVEYTGEDYIHMEIDLWDYYYDDPPPANERYFHIAPLELPFLANRPCEKIMVTIGSELIVCIEENGRLKRLVSINLDKRDPFYKRSQDQYEEEITIIMVVYLVKIRVYKNDKIRDLMPGDPEFEEWVKFDQTTVVSLGSEARFTFTWGTEKGPPFEVYFGSNLTYGELVCLTFVLKDSAE
jgi:hypothetical protein